MDPATVLAQTPWQYGLAALAISALFVALQRANDRGFDKQDATITRQDATIADLRVRADGKHGEQTTALQQLASGFAELVAMSKGRRDEMDRRYSDIERRLDDAERRDAEAARQRAEILDALREVRAEARMLRELRGGD